MLNQLIYIYYLIGGDIIKKRIHDFLPNIKDYYTINDKGEIYSDNSGLMKSRNKGKTEYQIINFQTIDGKKKTYRVHRLVLMAFKPIDNPDSMEVNHIDGNKKNNSLDNLEWCTSSENQKHAYRTGLQKARKSEKSNLVKLTEEVFELRAQGWLEKDIAKIVGCTKSNISCILLGKSWKA